MNKDVFSLCFMCSVRCPIKVSVKDGHVDWIQGNPHVAGIDSRLCPRGSAGNPCCMMTSGFSRPDPCGDRGSGNWRKASWDEALDYVGSRLKEIKETHGGMLSSWENGPNWPPM